jgi:peptidyl-prolyl cis-trans isomerase D
MIRFLQSDGKIKKYVLSGILIIICIGMVTYLTQGISSSGSGLTGPAKGVVATVGSDQITAQEVVDQGRTMLRQQFPRGNAMAEQMLPYFNQQAFEQLINQKALIIAAQNMGLRVSDAELREEFEHGQYSQTFFPGGKFIGEDKYEEVLREANLTPTRFEELEKDNLLFQKLRTMVSGAAAVSNSEVDVEARKRNTKVKFDYAVVDAADVKKGIHPSEEELKAYFERNKVSYANSIPEKRKLVYAVVDLAKVQSQATVSDADLNAYYQSHADQYRVPEQALVRHILIKAPSPGTDGKVDPKALAAAQAKADDLLKQIKAGGDFGKLAQQNSEDPGSKDTQGLLGWIQRGRYGSPEIEKVIFTMAKGQTSDVLKSSYGFHIVRLEDKQDAHLKPLADVKADIEPLLKQQVAQRLAEAQANTLLTQARANGIESAAHGGAVTTDFVSSRDALPGIGVAPDFMTAAFGAKENAPPDLAHTAQGYAVYQVLAVQPPRTPSFDEIKSKVEEQFKNEQSGVLLSKKAQELSDRAKTSHDLKKAAKELGLTVKTSEPVLATGQVPDIGSMASEGVAGVFAGKPGDIVGPAQVGQNGAVLQIVAREEPTAAEMEQKKDEIRESLLQTKRQEIFGLYVTNLRQQMEKSGKIVINQAERKQLTGGLGPAGL